MLLLETPRCWGQNLYVLEVASMCSTEVAHAAAGRYGCLAIKLWSQLPCAMIRIWSCSNFKCIPQTHHPPCPNHTWRHLTILHCVHPIPSMFSQRLVFCSSSIQFPHNWCLRFASRLLLNHMWIAVFLKLLGVFQVIWAQLQSFKTLFFCTLWSSKFQRVKPSHGDLNSVSALYHIRFSVQYIAFVVSHVSNDSSKSCAKAEAVAAMAKELHQFWGTLEVEFHSFHRALCTRKTTRQCLTSMAWSAEVRCWKIAAMMLYKC